MKIFFNENNKSNKFKYNLFLFLENLFNQNSNKEFGKVKQFSVIGQLGSLGLDVFKSVQSGFNQIKC